MNKKSLTRRQFLTAASLGTAAAVASAKIPSYGNISKKATKLAIHGGQPVRTKSFPSWPIPDKFTEESLVSTFRTGNWYRFAGNVTSTFEKKFAELMGAKYCLATGSGTQAMHTAFYSVGIEAGDEVLVPPCSFISCVQVILLCNALPVFVDIDPESWQINPDKMEERINGNTKAIEPVYVSGLPPDMGKILAIAKKHNLKVVEDACQAHLAEWKGKKAGTLGDLGCFSFQESKHLPCGEGGAVVGNDKELIEKCFSFHNLGSPRKNTYDPITNEPIKYIHIATKYRMNEFEASILLPQFELLKEQTNRRFENAQYLTSKIKEIPGIIPQKLYEGVTKAAYHLYGFNYKKEHFNGIPRDRFLEAIKAEGIPIRVLWPYKLNKQPFIEHTLNSRAFKKIFSEARLKRYREENECPRNDYRIKSSGHFSQTLLLGSKKDMDDIADAFLKVYENRDKLT